MFPYFIPEQETRANLHLRSLTFLAESLNRIMVLPNVGNSRIDCCTKFPFEFYYDLEKMKKMFPSIKFSYSIRDHNQMAVEPGVRYEKNLLSKLCINQFDLKISDYMEFHTGIGHVNDFEHKMFNFFTENLKDIKSPVILLQSYYCIHWRMEQGILEKMPKCAENLIETINYLKMTEEINNVYLATDYPISGGKSASDTFYSVRKEHRIAIQMLNSTLNFNTWVSLNAFKEFRNDKNVGYVQLILDLLAKKEKI
ncbi:hypothetical protein RhiirC2_407459 [Rhizophagus irregularis]|uniref:Uncharacterized protein n=1 Tax=Rhizophagus irregularis TaxID=588596 RepID=A0A2N1NDD6_9GLOM|nr:hypothetical protein RhiirC2_407459 [Rhizophagus irregularis]